MVIREERRMENGVRRKRNKNTRYEEKEREEKRKGESSP